MSLQAAISFREKINADPALQARVRELAPAGQTLDVTALGASLGFSFSRAEAEQAYSPDDELSDFELEMVQSAAPAPCVTPRVDV
jgi:predicted ribosomally synthesized peptide with nif11-like leader